MTRLGVGAQWVAEADFAAIDLTHIRIGAYSAQVHQESAQDNYVSVYQDGLALSLFRRLVGVGGVPWIALCQGVSGAVTLPDR